MRIPPWSVIGSWPKANYVDPATRGNALLVVNIIFSALVVAAVCGRYYARIVVKKWYGWDDAMMFPASIAAVGLSVVVILANKRFGWDRHIWDLPYDEIQGANIIAFVAKELFVVACTFTRLSLTCFYYRLVKDSGISWFKWILHACLGFNIAIGITFFALGIWLCVPVKSYWTFPPTGNYRCMDEGTVLLVAGAINCVADLLTTTVPIPLVMRLAMPLKQRIGVCVLLGLGVVVTIAGVLRTYFTWKSLIDSWDETWYTYPLWICASVEIDVAVMCACAPALKALVHARITRITSRISEKLGSARSHGRGESSQDTSHATQSSTRTIIEHANDHGKQPNMSARASDEEMLDVRPDDEKDATRSAAFEMGQHRRADASSPRRFQPLEIMRRQSVDQESSYIRKASDAT